MSVNNIIEVGGWGRDEGGGWGGGGGAGQDDDWQIRVDNLYIACVSYTVMWVNSG